MRTITKGPAPRALITFKQQGGTDFDSSPKGDIRSALLLEQRGLCCYCMCRIHSETMKIEHWDSQSEHTAERLNFTNMLGACPGGEKAGADYRHCDTHRGNTPLVINPAVPGHRVEQRVRYLVDGTIRSDEATVNEQLDKTLNLNLPSIKNGRKGVITALQQRLNKGTMSNEACASELKKWDGSKDGNLEPFAGVVAYFLRKRIPKA
jgi:uncharacterized protein (TIGR02646 family)